MAGGAPVPACKEWAVVIDALLRGEQILDLRKGGIHEEGRRFELRVDRFWLFPTYEHQDADLLEPAHRPALERTLADQEDTGPDHVRIDGWADVAATALLTDPEPLAALQSEFVWTAEYATARLRWKRRQPLWLLALRVHRLDEPLVVPLAPEYGGCSSWVTLHGVADDPASLPGEPVIEAGEFERRLRVLADAIPGELIAARGPRVDSATDDLSRSAAASPRLDP